MALTAETEHYSPHGLTPEDQRAFDIHYDRAMQELAAEEKRALHTTGLSGAIAAMARVIAACFMLVIWFFIVGPIWLAVLLRTISYYSIATVAAIFSRAEPPNPERLDSAAVLWMRGFHQIVGTMRARTSEETVRQFSSAEAVTETVLAIVFYGFVFLTIKYGYDYISIAYHYLSAQAVRIYSLVFH